MTPSYTSLLTSSFLLWLNNIFINNSSGFYNVSSLFYPVNNALGINQTYQGYYTYQIPYSQQIISDSSVLGANIISGVYLNGNFINPGQSGFVSLNYDNGQAIFNQILPAKSIISGNYAIKQFNIQLTSLPEEKLLFQTNYVLNPLTPQISTGAPLDSIGYPILMVKAGQSQNKPMAFGGEDQTINNITVFVFADSQYNLDCVTSYLCDMRLQYVPFLKQNEFPYNVFGGLWSGQNFNYSQQTSTKLVNGSGILISEVVNSRFPRSDLKNLNPNLYFGTVDFTLNGFRYPRFNPYGITQNH